MKRERRVLDANISTAQDIYCVPATFLILKFEIEGARGQRACQRSPFYTQTSGRSSEFGKRGHSRFHVQRIALNYKRDLYI